MQFRIKSYFFIGSSSLVFTLLHQIRHLWSNLPWWVYLLTAGLILITIASINEMNKNKEEKKLSFKWKEKIKNKFKDWQ